MHSVARSILWTALVIAGSSTSQVALAACPDYSLNGTQATYSSDQLYTPVRRTLTAGGDMDLAQCNDVPGTGWVTRQPDYTIRITGNSARRRRLQFRTQADCDTVLLVNTPTASWVFDDDGGDGLNAKVDIQQAADGIYDVWVGTSGADGCQATMISETFNNGTSGGGTRKTSR